MSEGRSGWTVETLKEHIDQRFSDWQRHISDAKHSVERAEDQAAQTRQYTEVKNNEFRGQLADQAAMLMPRAEADQRYATTMQAQSEARSTMQKIADDLRDSERRSIDELRSTMQKGLDEIRRLVYIAAGIAMAAAVAIPLLLRR